MGGQPPSPERSNEPRVSVLTGGIEVFDSLLIRQEIRAGETEAVLDVLSDWVAANRDGDVRTLLPVDGVTLLTLFLDRGEFHCDGTGSALLWYVEVVDDDADAWETPDETVRNTSPLYETELRGLLKDDATVFVDGQDGHQHVTHATHPHRQEHYAGRCGRPLVAPVAGDDLPIVVAITSVPLKSGGVSWLVTQAVRLGNWFKQFDRISEWLRDQTDTLEEEAMYTESLSLEPVDGRRVLQYYMETEDMDRLYDAYGESDNWEVRFSDWVMRRIFLNPDQMLSPPLESDCDVLIHAVHPERP